MFEIERNRVGEAYYYLRDAHGDTIGLAESTGSVIKDYKHDAFGNLIAEYGTGAETPFRYNGQYYDEETGLIYLRNRYYDPSIGRFTQEDPAQDGLNWYVYCGNDPVNMVDPWGTDAIVITNSNAARKQGHTSAIYQDSDGEWYYTYWGDKAAAVIHIQKDYMSSLDDFNIYLNTFLSEFGLSNITSDYTDATYVYGDFTTSLKTAYDDVYEAYNSRFSSGEIKKFTDDSIVFQGHNSPYNLMYRNCFDKTYNSLSQGTLSNGVNAGDYMSKLGLDGGMVPNNAVNKFSEIFMNNSFYRVSANLRLLNYFHLYLQGSPWAQVKDKFSYASYAVSRGY